MSFHNELEMRNWEYRQYLLKPKPLSQKDGERAEALWRKLHKFNLRVEEILKPFDTKYCRTLMAILDTMPGNFDFMIESWLEQLRGLGILKEEEPANH